MITRYSKIAIILFVATFSALVAINNITDYSSNFEFVRHVLSMDSTFPGNRAMYRAINSPWLWHSAYALIICGEILTAALLIRGGLVLWRTRNSCGVDFHRAKNIAVLGFTTGFVVWFFGFIVIGGEWFLMWQSPHWNGQQAAFRFYMAILGCLIYVNQYDADLY